MSRSDIRRKTISLDCDTIYFSDILRDFRSTPEDCGCSFYFHDQGNKVSIKVCNSLWSDADNGYIHSSSKPCYRNDRQGVVNKSLPSLPSTLSAHLLLHQPRTKHEHHRQHTREGGDIPIRQHGCLRLSVRVSAKERLQQSS